MTWFSSGLSSGLSNLKEQFNSLINDDDDNEPNPRNLAESIPPNPVDKDQSLLQSLRQYGETNEEDEHPKQSQFPFTYRRDVIKYSKTLNDLLNDVNFLNASLDEVVGNVVRYIDENELLRHEANILKDEKIQQEMNVLPPETKSEADSITLNRSAEVEVETGRQEAYENSNQSLTSNSSPPCREKYDFCKVSTTDKDTQTDCADDVDKEWPKDTEVTEFAEQIENLIIETDVISEKLNCIEKSWQKTKKDDDACVAIRTDILTDYTSLAHRRDILWEKLKVSFVWPTVAKFKNAKISELSVPDSIKEVFQPGFVPRSDDDDSGKQTVQLLAQSQAPAAARNVGETESISVTTQYQPEYLENDGEFVTATVQRSEELVGNEKSESATTSNAMVEVDRLRKHLISIEQAYTNELLQCEEEIQILRNELKNKEEKLNSVTESYTSMNLSTNKTVEKLQNEMKQLSDDKMQLTTQLCRCQSDLEKSVVDTRNLRSALDLFYKNKDSEVVQAKEKLNSRIEELQNDNERLRETVASLRKDLDTSQHIFKKNEILSEELKAKQEEANTLKMKVEELMQQRFQNTDEGKHNFKMATSSFDVEAKMRLNLIKNVAFRYITSDSPTTKSQSLRILADVLEFSDGEKMKIGIREQTCEKTKNNQSLIDEFIRFVEKESHPRTTQAETYHHHQQQMRQKLSASFSSELSPTTVIATANTSINLPARTPTSSSSILLKDALNSNDI